LAAVRDEVRDSYEDWISPERQNEMDEIIRAHERGRIAERIREDAVLFEAERKVDGGWIFRIIGPSLMTIYEHCATLAETNEETE
jgi:hypothetical protein